MDVEEVSKVSMVEFCATNALGDGPVETMSITTGNMSLFRSIAFGMNMFSGFRVLGEVDV